jgi:hypothetical protein
MLASKVFAWVVLPPRQGVRKVAVGKRMERGLAKLGLAGVKKV